MKTKVKNLLMDFVVLPIVLTLVYLISLLIIPIYGLNRLFRSEEAKEHE